MNCDILRLPLFLLVSPSLHFTLYWLLKYSPIPAALYMPLLIPPAPSPLSFAPRSLSPCSTLSCTIHLANLIFGVDTRLNRDPCFLIHLSPSPNLSFPCRSFTPFLICLPPFFCGILIMKSGCSPSCVLAAFVVLKVTNRLLICSLWFLKLTDICIILLPAFPFSKVACWRSFHWMELRAVNIMACLIRFRIFVERSVRELQKYAASKMSLISKKPDWSRAQKVKCFIFPLWQVGLIRFL